MNSLEELRSYADEQLWMVVHQRLATDQNTRLYELIERGKEGQITEDGRAELKALIELVDHQMLLRSEALLLLKQRGHDVEQQLNLEGGKDEHL
jgi:hypothetical protein